MYSGSEGEGEGEGMEGEGEGEGVRVTILQYESTKVQNPRRYLVAHARKIYACV